MREELKRVDTSFGNRNDYDTVFFYDPEDRIVPHYSDWLK